MRPGPFLLTAVGVALACLLVIAVLSITGRGGAEAIAGVATSGEDEAGSAAPGSRPGKCLECGVIESMREITVTNAGAGTHVVARAASGNIGPGNASKVRNYEITIRLQDGSRRVITDTNSATWRHGDRVKLIAGAP